MLRNSYFVFQYLIINFKYQSLHTKLIIIFDHHIKFIQPYYFILDFPELLDALRSNKCLQTSIDGKIVKQFSVHFMLHISILNAFMVGKDF